MRAVAARHRWRRACCWLGPPPGRRRPGRRSLFDDVLRGDTASGRRGSHRRQRARRRGRHPRLPADARGAAVRPERGRRRREGRSTAWGSSTRCDADVTPAEATASWSTFRVTGTAARPQRHRRGQQEAQEGGGRRRAPHPAAHHPRPREGAPGHRGGPQALRREGLPRRQHRLRRPCRWATNEVDLVYRVDGEGAVRVEDIEFEGNKAFSTASSAASCRRKRWILSPITGAGDAQPRRAAHGRRAADGLVLRQRLRHRPRRRAAGRAARRRPRRHRQDRRGRAVPDRHGRRSTGEDAAPRHRKPPSQGRRARPARSSAPAALRDDVQTLTERLSEDGYAFANVEPATDVDARREGGQRHLPGRARPPGDRRPHRGHRQHQDARQRDPPRDAAAGAGALLRHEAAQEPRGAAARSASSRRSTSPPARAGGRRPHGRRRRREGGPDRRLQRRRGLQLGATTSCSTSASRRTTCSAAASAWSLNVDVGSIRRNIILSFTEPYFRDTPLTVGFDAFSWRLAFDDFDRSGTGASTPGHRTR